jgi:hypothetical protein
VSHAAGAVRKTALTTWEGIWYVLMCVCFAYGYFAKIPTKKALSDFGLTVMTSAEQFWYVLMCIWFGAGYFAKIPVAKAISELPEYRTARQASLGSLPQPPQGPGLAASNETRELES